MLPYAVKGQQHLTSGLWAFWDQPPISGEKYWVMTLITCIYTQSATTHSSNGVSSQLRRPDTLDIFNQPLGNDSIDLSRLLLSHKVRGINLGFLEVLALAAHVGRNLGVVHRRTDGIVCRVDLVNEHELVINHMADDKDEKLTNKTGNSMLPSFLRFSSVYLRLAAWLEYHASPGQNQSSPSQRRILGTTPRTRTRSSQEGCA